MIMENSKTDLSSFQSYSEIQFLQQVKECQDHLQYMEKLFFDLQNKPKSEKQVIKSQISLNDFDQSRNKQYKLNTSSIPDLNLLKQESETKTNVKNNLFTKTSSTTLQNEVPINSQVDSINIDDTLSPLTFVIRVPNSFINYLKKKVPGDNLIDTSTNGAIKELLKTQRKTRSISLLQKLFKKKKNILSTNDTKLSQKTETLQFLKEKTENNFTNSLQNSNKNNFNYSTVGINIPKTEKNIIDENSTNAETDSNSNNIKEKQTLIFPITYNFDEKTYATIKSNLTIHHEIIPQTNSNSWSHCIKITNEVPSECLNTSNTTETTHTCKEKKIVKSTKEELQSSEIILENLLKTLFKTAEKLNNLDALKNLLENFNEKELKLKKFKQINKTVKLKDNKKSKALNLLLQHIVVNTEKKMKYSRSLERNVQIPKKQLSKLSVCSSIRSLSSDEEFYRSPVVIKRKQIQKQTRCQSPSMLNYLVCQSERDINKKR